MDANVQSDFLKTAVDGGVVTVTIDRPQRKNAMTQAMWREMARLFRAFADDDAVRAVVLRGAGGDFCAGADIGEFETVRGSADSARLYESENSAAFAAVRDCPVPTIAAIGGICFGGGFGMAAACDIRIAAADAVFSVPAAKLGLAYPVDAMADIVHAVGPQVARHMAYSAARLDAAAALSAGFLLEVVERRVLERPHRAQLRAGQRDTGRIPDCRLRRHQGGPREEFSGRVGGRCRNRSGSGRGRGATGCARRHEQQQDGGQPEQGSAV